MILLDVVIPALSLSVDIRTKDSGKIRVLIKEITELVRQRIGENAEESDEFILYSPSQRRVLPEEMSIKECGLMTGSRVMLL
ncbi:MAG: hypothetical protein IJU77_00105 [Butyrivibrio sp.]|nr:hypothetical protein [Butyrivibrio sp.]